MFGHLNCKTCGQRYQAPINSELWYHNGLGSGLIRYQICLRRSMCTASKYSCVLVVYCVWSSSDSFVAGWMRARRLG
jgi:hypothetical protein